MVFTSAASIPKYAQNSLVGRLTAFWTTSFPTESTFIKQSEAHFEAHFERARICQHLRPRLHELASLPTHNQLHVLLLSISFSTDQQIILAVDYNAAQHQCIHPSPTPSNFSSSLVYTSSVTLFEHPLAHHGPWPTFLGADPVGRVKCLNPVGYQ
ncbi:hypothetical protein CPC08DRAFT_364160 [Agrocybe pediades]|nr:hypothetical protein CPC08DRAFT_364160 [Agrocybe pediades]